MSEMTREETLVAIATRIAGALPPERRSSEIALYARVHGYTVEEIAAEVDRRLKPKEAAP